jgi:DNA-3-methyladenine glycosylase II
MTILQIDLNNQNRAIAELSSNEPVFQAVVDNFGVPPLWEREEGFPTLIRIILEQQVSLASAKTAYDKLVEAAGELTPARFIQFTDEELKTIGFSRQKTSYGKDLAQAVQDGSLDPGNLSAMTDNEVRAALISIKGIGIWTANIYLLMAMQRPDVWPRGDIALAASYHQLKGLPKRPGNDAMEKISRTWAPWRSVAARLLWHNYLSRKGL